MIYTFYSYKGGVGRSMALANVAELFYQAGLKVLMVDWDLEAPGLERFFPVDWEQILNKPGVIDMLLGYKEQMAQELPALEEETGSLPFEKPGRFTMDIYPDVSGGGRLWLIPSGRRSREHFAEYAYAVRTFDWQDFYQSWEGELYFEWLRQQFEQMADVVLIDSRTGVTEMGGVCTYQLADVALMLCTPNQQSLDGTDEMARNFTSPEVQRLRHGRPLDVLIVPARIERAESDSLDRFQELFTSRFRKFVPDTREIDIQQLWESGVPYIPKYAYEEAVAVRESGRASAEDMVVAFRRLGQVMSCFMPEKVLKKYRKRRPSVGIARSYDVEKKLARAKISSDVEEGLGTQLRVLVATPDDVLDERARLGQIVDGLNITTADRLGLTFDLLDWRAHIAPCMGRPQQVILDELSLNRWDVFVGILWARFGTPPGTIHPETGEPFLSGTEEEFTLACQAWKETERPQILLYRCTRPISTTVDVTQLKEVQDFLSGFGASGTYPGLYRTYETLEDFERCVREDLTQLLIDYSEEQLLTTRRPALAQQIAELEAVEPQPPPSVYIPFTNREDELKQILSSFAPPYHLIDAPAGYGKTALLRELEHRFEEQGWMCAYVSVQEHRSIPDIAQALATELGVSLSPGKDARLLGLSLGKQILEQREQDLASIDSDYSRGVVLLIDVDKRPWTSLFPTVDALFTDFIPGVEYILHRSEFFRKAHNPFRVIFAGRYLAGKTARSAPFSLSILKLTLFDYEVIRDIVRAYLSDQAAISQLSAHLMYYTGGHPSCLARVLDLYQNRKLPPDDFFRYSAEEIMDGILYPEANAVRNDILRNLRRVFDDLTIFRYLDSSVLRHLLDEAVYAEHESEFELADELIGTYLMDWKGRLLRNDITRRLLANRLLREIGPRAFAERCQRAQKIYASRLQEPNAHTPERWAIEYLFQSLQQHTEVIQVREHREEVRQSFFGETVPKALQFLIGVNGRNAREEHHALKRALEVDWEFLFIVNYYLRHDEYNEEPYGRLQEAIDQFFS